MKPLLYVVCSGFDLTCEGEKRLSKNRRAVNCGAKERGGKEGRKGLLVTRSEGERLKGQIYMCGENRSAWHACLPFSKTCVAKREGGVPREYREIFGCKIPTFLHCFVGEDFLGL